MITAGPCDVCGRAATVGVDLGDDGSLRYCGAEHAPDHLGLALERVEVRADDPHVALWKAINDYARACGGDPGSYVHGNIRRQEAVAAIEAALRRERSGA